MSRYLRFRINHEWYGVSVEVVARVLHLMAITPLPDVPAHILGVMTLHGETVTVLDLRRLLRHQAQPLTLNTPLIVLRTAGGVLALVVEEVDNVVMIVNDLEVPASGKYLLAGLTRHADTILMVLDTAALAGTLHQPAQ